MRAGGKELAERGRVWDGWKPDPEWVKARGESEENGPIGAKIENMMLSAPAYSKLK